MATLKEHQAAMVDLLANGSGIPASASRPAHAMHDVIDLLYGKPDDMSVNTWLNGDWSTTPGLNDVALAYDLATVKPKRSSAEQQIAMLNNTILQLRAQVAKQRKEIAFLKMERNNAIAQLPERAECRKEDTQL